MHVQAVAKKQGFTIEFKEALIGGAGKNSDESHHFHAYGLLHTDTTNRQQSKRLGKDCCAEVWDFD